MLWKQKVINQLELLALPFSLEINLDLHKK